MTQIPAPPDNHQLSQWREDFLSLQRQKLEAVFTQLPSQWGPVLSAIPLLFHVNRSRLPGFVSHDTPTGIQGLIPTDADKEQLKKLAGQEVPLSAMTHRMLGGIFLINNPVALSQPATEVLHIRVCSQGALEDFQLQNLIKKCARIQEWAMSQRVPLKLSIHTPDTLFSASPEQAADAIDSDTFYTSATLLAGNPPFWWCMPAEADDSEDEYWQQLLEQDDFSPTDYLRLPAPEPEAGQSLADRAVTVLEQALSAPYSWLNPLKQLDSQLRLYPQHPVMAQSMRLNFQQGQKSPGTVDADHNLAVLFLSETNPDDPKNSTELLRRALYFSTGISLTQLTPGQRKRWRVQIIESLIQSWGWSPSDLAWLDSHADWTPAQVLKERNQIASLLLTGLLQLQQFLQAGSEGDESDTDVDSLSEKQNQKEPLHQTAPVTDQKQGSAADGLPDDELLNSGYAELRSATDTVRLSDPARLSLLQNRMAALLESNPDKIADINPGIRAEMHEDKMTLQRRDDLWRLLQGSWNPDQPQEVIYQSDSLVRLLIFAHRNGLLGDYSHLAVVPEHAVNQFELKALISDIKDIPLPQASEQNFAKERVITGWQLFVNSGEKSSSLLSRMGKEKVSDLDDALNFSANRENLIRTLEVFSRNSWGEWQVEYLDHEHMVHETLMKVLNARAPSNPAWPPLSIHCHNQTRRVVILQRLNALFGDIMKHFSHPGASPYLLQTGPFHLLESRLGQIISHDAAGHKQLMKILSQPRRKFRRWQLDPYALQDTGLRYVLEKAPAEHWQLWFWRQPGKVTLYIMDDRGSLISEEHTTHKVKELLLARLSQMNTLNQRFTGTVQNEPWPMFLGELVQNAETRQFSHQKRRIPSEAYSLPPKGLTATVDSERQLTLVSSGQIFRQQELGNQLFQELIGTLGSDTQSLPPYLRDIRVENNQQLITHLQYVQRIEHYLSISRQPQMLVPEQNTATSPSAHTSH